MKKKEIWIFVEGGMVTQVKSTMSNVKVNLIDYDNLKVPVLKDDEEYKKEITEAEQLSENEFVIF